MKQFGKNIIVWIFIFMLVATVFSRVENVMEGTEIAFSNFVNKVENDEVSAVIIEGNKIQIEGSDGQAYNTYAPSYPELVTILRENNVAIKAEDPQQSSFIAELFLRIFPILIFIAIWIFFMKQMEGGKGGGAMSFGKSKAKLMTNMKEKVTFTDVAGIDEAKEELSEIVDFLRNPAKFHNLGGKIPRGVLLTGSPGTGKTLLARAIAGEANVPFFSISGSDFVEMFVGVGASRVRDMFEQGRKSAPCIIFIDEIDAVGRHRGAGMGGGNDEREQTLNQMLVEMDGFDGHEGVIIVAATNRPDVLDPALLRPGRFDRQVVVPLPDVKGREEILNIHLKKVPQGPDVDPSVIARGTPGFSGADLANLINEAALLSARNDKKVVTMSALENAKDKVMMGAERKSMVMSDEEKKMTAYHEAGHAIVSIHCPASDPIHKATIIPRGRALGMVMRLPEADKLSYHRDAMHADIAVAMGGRVAEEIIFGHDKVSSGASSDIQHATKLARAMVSNWGMSDEVGPLDLAVDSSNPYSPRASSNFSEKTSELIDKETKRIVNEGLKRAEKILTDFNKELHLLGEALLEYETLSGDEIKTIIAGKNLNRDSVSNPKDKTPIKSFIPKSSNDNSSDTDKDSKKDKKKTTKKATSKTDKETDAKSTDDKSSDSKAASDKKTTTKKPSAKKESPTKKKADTTDNAEDAGKNSDDTKSSTK